MPKPITDKKLHEQDRVERSINTFAQLKNPSAVDMQRVAAISQVETQLDLYRAPAEEMTRKELQLEEHQSKRLAQFMELTSDPRPHPHCHAHAIVSGSHKGAARQRAVIAWYKLRIDDPDNGCWLPRNTAALANMPDYLRKAVPHSRIHRYNYYFWLDREISMDRVKNGQQLRGRLKQIETRLQAGAQPRYVMNRKGVGLPR